MMNETKRRSARQEAAERKQNEREAMEREAEAHDEALARAEGKLVDIGSEYSFPASDPPSFMGGAAVAGAPPNPKLEPEEVVRRLSDPKAAQPSPPLAPELRQHRKAEKTPARKKG